MIKFTQHCQCMFQLPAMSSASNATENGKPTRGENNAFQATIHEWRGRLFWSFINALRRFIARRGCPEQIRSDNGGNFVKGEKELREALQAWNQAQIHECLLQHDVKWIFNPPTVSHFGGVWERCIRTVRKVMKALL